MITKQHVAIPVRLETGPLQMGTDWPGVFLRGDEALAMADNLEMMADHFSIPRGEGSLIAGMLTTLRSCRES